MIDIHCHLLPGIDDGPQNIDDALALARAAVADGVSHAVVTPHVFPGRFNNVRSSIEFEHQRFASLLKVKKIPLKLSFSGEVRLDGSLLEMLERDEIPFLGQCGAYRTILLELPDSQIPLGTMALMRHLVAQGIRPVIAHPERNKAVMETPERAEQFIDAGCFLQITAGSLLGQFGPRVGAAADFLLGKAWVSAVASDAHNLDGRRHRMSEACVVLEQRFGRDTALSLLRLGPAALCGIELGAGVQQV